MHIVTPIPFVHYHTHSLFVCCKFLHGMYLVCVYALLHSPVVLLHPFSLHVSITFTLHIMHQYTYPLELWAWLLYQNMLGSTADLPVRGVPPDMIKMPDRWSSHSFHYYLCHLDLLCHYQTPACSFLTTLFRSLPHGILHLPSTECLKSYDPIWLSTVLALWTYSSSIATGYYLSPVWAKFLRWCNSGTWLLPLCYSSRCLVDSLQTLSFTSGDAWIALLLGMWLS
jgi:hypothetical protein